MSSTAPTANPFESVYAVIGKRLRNKRKKLDKIKNAEAALKSKKELTPEQVEMVNGKDELLSQIKELEEMNKGIKTECNKLKSQLTTEETKAETPSTDVLENGVKLIADACLVNSLHQNFDQQILAADEHTALATALTAITAASAPAEVINYQRVREGFVQLFTQLVSKSDEIIPGSSVSFNQISEKLTSLPKEVTHREHTHQTPEPLTEEPIVESEPKEKPEGAMEALESWAPEEEEEAPTKEDLPEKEVEEHPN